MPADSFLKKVIPSKGVIVCEKVRKIQHIREEGSH